jgi:hypothetical protein
MTRAAMVLANSSLPPVTRWPGWDQDQADSTRIRFWPFGRLGAHWTGSFHGSMIRPKVHAGRSRRGHRGAPGRGEAQGGALGADNGRRRGSMVMPSWAGQTALARKLLQRAARAGA